MSLFSVLKIFKSNKPPACTAVIAAAGTSQRCKGEDKLFYHIDGKPVLAYTIEAFQKCDLVNEIIVVAHEDKIGLVGEMCKEFGYDKVSSVIIGGPTRTESVLFGIYAVSKKARLIAIHDGARPCVDIDVIEKTVKKAAKFNAAAPAVSITSTVKKIERGIIVETVDRDGLFEIQTPQVFRSELIKGALTNVLKKSIDVTDDCMAVELLGAAIYTVEGSRKNIKITDNDDLMIAKSYLADTFLREEKS